jgi:hypothetical protein
MAIEDFRDAIPADFDDRSRVWIFQASRSLTPAESEMLRVRLKQWVSQWKAHAEPVKGWADVLFQRFVVFMADETAVPVSGCSTDGLMRFVKQIEQQFQISLFDRLLITFLENDRLFTRHLAELYPDEFTESTRYFNNAVLTKKDWIEQWILPVHEGWLGEHIQQLQH